MNMSIYSTVICIVPIRCMYVLSASEAGFWLYLPPNMWRQLPYPKDGWGNV